MEKHITSVDYFVKKKGLLVKKKNANLLTDLRIIYYLDHAMLKD